MHPRKIKFSISVIVLGLALVGHASRGASDRAAKVLFIGDSHSVLSFGVALEMQLRTLRPETSVWTFASCGTKPIDWITSHTTDCGSLEITPDAPGHQRSRSRLTPHLPALLGDIHPDVTVIALGSNLIYASNEEIERSSRELAAFVRASGSACIWIGPPPGRNKPPLALERLYRRLALGLGNQCDLIDSRPLIQYPESGGDGAHYDTLGAPGRDLARTWAREVFEQILIYTMNI